MIKILAVPSDEGACAYYRLLAPLNALQFAGKAEVTYVPRAKPGSSTRPFVVGRISQEEWDKMPFAEKERVSKLPNVAHYNVLVLQRVADSVVHESLKAQLRALGVKLVIDIDDDALSIPDSNPNYLHWGRDARKVMGWFDEVNRKGIKINGSVHDAPALAKRTLQNLLRNLSAADLVTVTTPSLKRTYSTYSQNIAILPNQMVPNDWKNLVPIAHPGEVWFGWAGSHTHFEDLRVCASAVEETILQYPKARLVIAGFKGVGKVLFSRLDTSNQLIEYPWTTLEKYRQFIASFDVVLAPSKGTRFNEGKSDIRVLEAGMVSRPVIASETTYGNTIRECGGGGFIAKSSNDWMKAIAKLAQDETLRVSMGRQLNEYVMTKRVYDIVHGLWEDAYLQVLAGSKPNDHATYNQSRVAVNYGS